MKTQSNFVKVLAILVGGLVALFILTSSYHEVELKNKVVIAYDKVMPPPIDIYAAIITNNMNALKQHIAAGSNLNQKDPYGSSPLMVAALFDKAAMASMLIEAGANVNFRNNEGSTALHAAAFFCRPQIVNLLLESGADKTIINQYGNTAYQSVASEFSQVKDSYDLMSKMLEPMGVKLDYPYLKKTRPEIAAMLK